ncbi:MAG: hypothetical protein LBR80_12305 [Deltaproteobacteria bacterium]|jgi:hypothetical protein|nr:hypothetical protein [Deltaproteobacteria bacterium]
MLFTLLNVKGQRARMEVNLGDGRVYLVHRPSKAVFVIEIKYDTPGHGLTPEQISVRLDACVSDVFDQIDKSRYSRPYFGNGKDIYAAAVGVHGYSDARIRFRQKIHLDGRIQDIGLSDNL